MNIKNLNTTNLKNIDFFNNLDVRYKPSSVFILIFVSKNKDEILFLKRSNNLKMHKGENVSLEDLMKIMTKIC